MNILFIAGSFPPDECGVGHYVFHLVKALARISGNKIAVVTNINAGKEVEYLELKSHGNIEIFPIVKGWMLGEYPAIRSVVKSWNPDLIHIQYPTQGFYGKKLPYLLPFFIKLMNKVVIQTWHEGFRLSGLFKIFPISITSGNVIVVRINYMQSVSHLFFWVKYIKKIFFVKSASMIPKSLLSNEQKQEYKVQYANANKNLVVFFGFLYPAKGVEQIFEIADPEKDTLLLVGKMDVKQDYANKIKALANSNKWVGSVKFLDFLPDKEVANILAAADAVVLPFKDGGGEWNTSIYAAVNNDTFLLTTANRNQWYDEDNNIYYACPGDVSSMRTALRSYISKKRNDQRNPYLEDWENMADEHMKIYADALGKV